MKADFQNNNTRGRVGFAIGTGRCGISFLGLVLSVEPEVASVDERNRQNEAFHRYCKWYGLPVDDEGFLQTKEREIRKDLETHRFSFESSAQLSLSVRELYSRFSAKFILMVRSPERVVNAYLRKKWYLKPIVYLNPELALGYQELWRFHHFLGRIVPMGKEFLRWNAMSRVGKLAWYWNTLNLSVLEQFTTIPKTHWRIEKIEELTYDRYLEITKFLGIQSGITRQFFDEINYRHQSTSKSEPTIASWNSTEIVEFEKEVAPMAKKLGYEYQVDRLTLPEPSILSLEQQSERKSSKNGKIKRLFRKLKHRIDIQIDRFLE